MAGSALLSMIVISTFTTKTPEWLLWIAIVPSGFGISGLITSTLIALIAVVKKEDIAVATGGAYMPSVQEIIRLMLSRSHRSLLHVQDHRVS